MISELVVNVTPEEVSIAILEDKLLVELQKERCESTFSVGNIYLGKVKKLMPGLNAAFVDIGYPKEAFLHYLDLGPQFESLNEFLFAHLTPEKKKKGISMAKAKIFPDIEKVGQVDKMLKAGQEVLVQIAKEPISTKGPRITSEISIAGRNMVLIPFGQKVSVSQKIDSEEERTRLKQLLHSIKPKNFGVIVRTAAQGKRVAELDSELKGLVAKWEEHAEKLVKQKKPLLVYQEMNRVASVLRDVLNTSFTNIYVDNQDVCDELKSYIEQIAPEKANIIHSYKNDIPIFDHFGITAQIKGSFGKNVTMKKGSYLVIEHTEALHVIDVNSGNRTNKGDKGQAENALAVNLTAADEVARQLRLRDMGGIIVIDFIDMHDNDHKQQLFERMKEKMSSDRTKHNILPLSKFGLMQITRQRVRPEIKNVTEESCPTCAGTGTIKSSILFTKVIEDAIKRIVQIQGIKDFRLHLHPYIAAYINSGWMSLANDWRWKYGFRFKIVPNQSMAFLEFKFFDKYKNQIDLIEPTQKEEEVE